MNTAIIVAAGRGTRMGKNADKLFLEVAGEPILIHTWRRFEQSPVIDEIIVVVRDGLQADVKQLGAKFKKHFKVIAGGAERQDSVWNGLEAVSAKTEIVAIQDGARPCASQELIAATVDAAREIGAAVAAQSVTDTIK